MAITCDMLGEIHCGRELEPAEVANTCAAHLNHGHKPHEWRRFHQCKTCKAKSDEIASRCAGQETWRERRIDAGLSQGQMARLMGIDIVTYSSLERQRLEATGIVRETFEKAVRGETL